MKTLIITLLCLLPSTAFAIAREVKIPEKGNQNEYMTTLTSEHRLPEGISYEIRDKVLWIIGNGYVSATWTGYSKAEDDFQKEKTAEVAVVLGAAAVLAVGGYGVYKSNQA